MGAAIKTAMDKRFTGVLTSVDDADAAVTDLVAAGDYQVDPFAVRLLVREAMLNAVTHGCELDAKRHVELRIEDRGDALAVIVSDPGPGFKHCTLRSAPDTMADGGRGIPLMFTFADDVAFNERGNEVTLTFRRNARDAA